MQSSPNRSPNPGSQPDSFLSQSSAERDRLIRAYTKLGITLASQGEFEQAIAHFQKVLEIKPEPPKSEQARAHYNIGTVQVEQKKLTEAVVSLHKTLELEPTFARARYQLARVNYGIETDAKSYQFTQDWFSRNVPIWQEYLQPYIGKPDLNVLEVGSWEGRSTCWLLEQVLTHESARITCVDTFAGSHEHQALDSSYLQSLEERFDFNIQQTGAADKVSKRVGDSHEILRSLPLDSYDFIYVDASHIASDVLTDAVLSWGLLKRSGLLIFDDYDSVGQQPPLNVKLGVDAFLAVFQDKLELVHKSHQALVRKR